MGFHFFLRMFIVAVIAAAIQLLCCFLIKNKYLRHAGLLTCAIALGFAVKFYFTESFFIGGNMIGVWAFLITAACCLAGYGAAWGLYYQYRRKK